MTEPDRRKPITAAEQAAALKATLDRVRGKTDGCTMSPNMNFEVCCIEHDLSYRYNPDIISRTEADRRLRNCIQGRRGMLVAWAYWGIVRIFGRKNWLENNHTNTAKKPQPFDSGKF